ncbi:hypothetical protein DQ04_01871070 [Trypanosoma grayi]|uniref:hypothetical protein n=1 Tax=Trypanosoma grayi TaxID=71804 RepID=UPI0004F48057|nr:hypothetical protein DQ04_01871070 [Trypanosoma grayi]KEG12239.1 hypothetical protein DQ04_01871070 [Trypanosoma grayi]
MNALRGVDFITGWVDLDGMELSFLLSAFVGCFVEEDEEEGEKLEAATASTGLGDMGVIFLRRRVLSGVRRAMRFLTHDTDAMRAKGELERVVDTACERHWLLLPSAQQCCNPEERERVMLQLLREMAGASSNSAGPSAAVLPCGLLHVVYYVVCAQCAPHVWRSPTRSRWSYLFFEQLVPVGVSPCVSAATSSHDDGTSVAQRLADMRRRIEWLFVDSCSGGKMTYILSFVDTYRAWLARDHRGVVDAAERFLHAVPWAGARPQLLQVMRDASCFMHAFAVAAVTNTASSVGRREAGARIRHVCDACDSVDRDSDNDGARELLGNASLSWRLCVMRDVYKLFRRELFDDNSGNNCGDDDGNSDSNDDGDSNHACDGCNQPAASTVLSWYSEFLLTLRVWLRAKRLTDGGDMTASRDLLLRTLNRLQGGGGGGRAVAARFATVVTADAGARCGASHSLNESEGNVSVWLVSSLWLRQLLLVNCAALADTKTLAFFLRCWRQPLTIAEVSYLATCPTLGADGVHSPILASFPPDDAETERTNPGIIESLEWLPLPVQVPLLAHRLWQLRQRLFHNHPQSPEVDASPYGCRYTQLGEMLHLCEVLVARVEGLFGSLELSFTDCAPHRIVYNAITMACDVQEDVLRDVAVSLADTPVLLPLDSPSSESSHDSSNVVSSNRTTTTTTAPLRHIDVETDSRIDSTLRSFHTSRSPTPSRTRSTTSEDWLAVVSVSSSRPSSDVSNVWPCTTMTAQDLYWFANREAAHWMSLLTENCHHLQLTVQVCQLRIAAASFDATTVLLARRLLASFCGNALAAAQSAVALFASLNVLPAERCIREAVQRYSHSAEMQRIYHMICGNGDTSKRTAHHDPEEKGPTQRKTKHTFLPVVYTHRYRGVLPVRCAISKVGSEISYISLVSCFLCVGLLVSSFVLHLREAKNGNAVRAMVASESGDGFSTATSNILQFQWSFSLPYLLPVYLGFGVVAYAVAVAVMIPFLAAKCGGVFNGMLRLLQVLMAENCLVYDSVNRLAFCLRGVPLVNLLTGVQLVASNARLLGLGAAAACDISADVEDAAVCDRVPTEMGVVGFLLIALLLVLGVVFHGSAWRVVRRCDVVVGSAATFITIFLLDVVFFIASFPLLFVCSVVLEPVFFVFIAVTGAALSPTLFVAEDHTSLPSDSMLLPLVTNAGVWRCEDATRFCVQGTLQLRERLLACLPPLLLSSGKCDCCPCGGAAGHLLSRLALCGINVCVALQRVVGWRSCRSPHQSEAAVQLALLRESWAAAVIEPPVASPLLAGEGRDDGAVASLSCAARSTTPPPPPRGKTFVMAPYG